MTENINVFFSFPRFHRTFVHVKNTLDFIMFRMNIYFALRLQILPF